MENNKADNGYSIGYNPDAVQHDLQVISHLTRGRRKLTTQQAQEIYYKIKSENIQFQSDTGENFLLELYGNMTDAQIQDINRLVRRKKQRKQNRKQILRLNRKIAVIVSAIVLISSIVCINWSLLMDFRTNYQTQKLQKKVKAAISENTDDSIVQKQDAVPTPGEIVSSNEGETENLSESGSANEVLLKFTQLYSENQDFAGWLRIPGTKIDYPVMSRDGDNNYYLDKNFEGQYDKNGLLILDYRNNIKNDGTAEKQNLIIYGHNMRTGVMFGTLKNYKEKLFCDEHMTISFDTLYEEQQYKVVAAMLSSVAYEDEDVFRYYDAIDISTEENFNAFKENIMSNAIYTTDETIEYGDTCLILSTCDNYREDGRFVVIAKRV